MALGCWLYNKRNDVQGRLRSACNTWQCRESVLFTVTKIEYLSQGFKLGIALVDEVFCGGYVRHIELGAVAHMTSQFTKNLCGGCGCLGAGDA